MIRSHCKMIMAAVLGVTSVIWDAGHGAAINQMDTELPLIKSEGWQPWNNQIFGADIHRENASATNIEEGVEGQSIPAQ